MKKAFKIIIFTVVALLVVGGSYKLYQRCHKEYYFDFDEVVHYNIVIEDSLIYHRHGKPERKGEELAMYNLRSSIMFGNVPKKVDDTSFESSLIKAGFTRKEIDKKKFAALNEIFCDKWVSNWEISGCLATYRDVLIFRKKSKTVGFAKICFECGDFYIKGTNANLMNFGMDGDYYRLYKLLELDKVKDERHH
jgi:hypothetical protein